MNEKSTAMAFLERNMLQIGLLAIGAYMLWKFTKGNTAQNTQDVKDSINILKSQGVTTTFLPAWYSQKAEQLYSALFSWGTDESTIFGIIGQLVNDADMLALINAFGSKRADVTEAGGLMWWTLPEYIRKDMSTSDISKLNNILSLKAIAFRF